MKKINKINNLVGQIFYRKNWFIKRMTNIKKWSNYFELSFVMRKTIMKHRHWNLLINNFLYCLRLNLIDEKKYVSYLTLIDILILQELAIVNGYKIDLDNFINLGYEKDVWSVAVMNNYQVNNFEQELLKKITINIGGSFNLKFCKQIANLFSKPMSNRYDYELYFDYGYLLAILFLIISYSRVDSKLDSHFIFITKLKIIELYNWTIAEITPLYFNDFVKQNNYLISHF